MESILATVEGYLKEEKTLYDRILEIEELKTSAILNRDGQLLEELTMQQEDLVRSIDLLEEKRMNSLSRSHGRSDVTLKELTGDRDHSVFGLAAELKSVIRKLRNCQDHNDRLARDNMRFFEALLSGLRETSSIRAGYGNDGREKPRVARPALFSQRA